MKISEKIKELKQKSKTAALGVTLAATSMFSTAAHAQNNSDNDILKAKVENTNQESMLLEKFLEKADKIRKDALDKGTAEYEMMGGDSYEMMHFMYEGSKDSKNGLLTHIPYYEGGIVSNVEGGEYGLLGSADGISIAINRNGVYKYVDGQESLVSGKEAVEYLKRANEELNNFSKAHDTSKTIDYAQVVNLAKQSTR